MREVDYSRFGSQTLFVQALYQLNVLKNLLRDASVHAKLFRQIALAEDTKMLQNDLNDLNRLKYSWKIARWSLTQKSFW